MQEEAQQDAPESQEDKLYQHRWNRRSALLYRVSLSIAYHRCRERFFDLTDKCCNGASALAATGAVVAVLGNSEYAQAVAVLTAAVSLVPLVFQPSAWARKHADLAYEHTYLRAKFLAYGEYWTEEQCDASESEFTMVEAKEPPALTGVVMYCQDRMAYASGHSPGAGLSWWQKMRMHFVDIDPLTERRQ